MIYIEGLDDNTIRLEKEASSYYSFKVVSQKPNGKPMPFVINFVSSKHINAEIKGDILSIDINSSRILQEETVTLINTLGERCKIMVIPNEYFTMEKTYTFKITSKKLLEDGSLKLKIFSKVNDMEIGWECTYDGRPMEYEITPFESEVGEHVIIKPKAEILNEFESLIEFTQKESNKVIKISLTNTPKKGITDYIYITNNKK
jgi:hypothetical protein